ncbi:SGS-domain-containing protein [Westerdykella ornata]|uniref:SGS-domain-containing protein n=1 Tax=Westerdykella ornata TaxID=318751 RepID=A0A6A6JJS2_WESOR|nr:SGS-domain-containing protein [Westerdykella ornata]KAF2276485.1 SGS-domain-containing protein [Westerdykella ornata]
MDGDKPDKRLPLVESQLAAKLAKLEPSDIASTSTVKEIPDVPLPEENQVKATKAALPDSKATSSSGTPTATANVPTPANKIKYDYYDTPEKVTITLFAKGVPKDKATIEIENDSLTISFPAGASDYNLTLDPLYAEVDPSTSTYRITPTKVEVVLKKAVPGKWKALESDRPASLPEDASTSIPDEVLRPDKPKEATPSYPTSSRTGAKNWDKLANDFDDDGEGADAAHSFFQKLYAGADPDTKRAMMKSYSESGGTVLSTDWKSVGSKEVVPQPPEGMEAKKW